MARRTSISMSDEMERQTDALQKTWGETLIGVLARCVDRVWREVKAEQDLLAKLPHPGLLPPGLSDEQLEKLIELLKKS
jgi:hypothetical protein